MATFIIRRLLWTIVVLVLVSVISFSMLHLIPGDPVAAMLGQQATPDQIQEARHELWLDRPIVVQYFHWLGNMLKGDFGTSIVYKQPVDLLLMQRLPVTLYLNFLALILSVALGLAAGVVSAVKRASWLDNLVAIFANVGVATPQFWLGIVGIYFIGLRLGWLPVQGFTSPTVDFVKSVRQSIMPVICLAVPFLAILARQTRSSMLEVIRQDYVQTARGKGLSKRVVVLKHGLKNALIPIVTLIGLEVRILVGGSVLVESVFNISGMGRLIVSATFDKDFLVVQACIMILSVIVCLVNLLVDISYGLFDPRIRYG